MNIYNQVGVSGGKDSTALALLTIERQVEPIVYTFADTGNEHPITLEYLDYLEDKLDIEIRHVKANITEAQFAKRRAYIRKHWGNARKTRKKLRDKDGKVTGFEEIPGIPEDIIEEICSLMKPTGNQFLDLCLLRTSFPASSRKFCSIELKQVPMLDQVIQPLINDGYTVVSWQGVRAQESAARAHQDVVELEKDHIIVYRPLIIWTHDDVFRMHKRHGIKVNPLYEQGMGRVGCMPCINCTKSEFAQISKRFPDQVDRLEKWEQLIAKVCRYTQATEREVGPSFFTKYKADGMPMTIREFETWSKTLRGGAEYDIQFDEDIDPDSCSAVYPIVCE